MTAISPADTAAVERFSTLLRLLTRFSYGTFSVFLGPGDATDLLRDAMARAPAEPPERQRDWLDQALKDWTVDALEKSANVDGGLRRGMETLQKEGRSRADYELALGEYRAALRRIFSAATEVRVANLDGTIYRFLRVGDQWFYFLISCDAHVG